MADVALVLGIVNVLVLAVLVIVLLRKPKPPTISEDKVALLVNQQLMQFQKVVGDALLGTRKEVEASKGEVTKSATEMHKHLGELGKTIEGLKQQNVGAQELAKNLQIMLQAPKLRGTHGEKILEDMLARLLPEGMWEAQVSIEGREAVDAVVRFKNTVFPIDAKFPRDDYERYMEAEAAEEKQGAWKAFERAIKTQVNSIAAKYIKPEAGTSDFALMFIPSEAVYYETIATTNGLGQPNSLADYAQANNVIPVSPNTLYAFLNVILIAADQMSLVENAKKLKEALTKVELSFDGFYNHYEKVGKSLAAAGESYGVADRHIGRFHDRVRAVLALDTEFEEAPDE